MPPDQGPQWGPMKFSVYASAESTWGEPTEVPEWDDFVEILRQAAAEVITGADKHECKDKALAFTASTYGDDGRRRKVNAERSWFVGVDCEGGDQRDMIQAIKRLTGMGDAPVAGVALDSVFYTSAGHTIAYPRFRIFIPLLQPVDGWEPYQAAWKGITSYLGVQVDTGKRNPSDLFYQPAQYSSAEENIFAQIRGHRLTASEWASMAPVEPEPAPPIEVKLTRRVRDMSKFVRQGAVDRYCSTPKKTGGKSHFRLMCSIAGTALESGYAITVDEVIGLFRDVDWQSGGHYANEPEARMRHEATNALNWARSRIVPK